MSASSRDIFGPRSEDALELSPAALEGSLRLLRRDEERGSRRDEWGNWDLPLAVDPGAHRRPEIDLRHAKKGRRSLWPDDRPFALLVTHDIDTLGSGYSWPESLTRAARCGFPQNARTLIGWLRRRVFARPGEWDFASWLAVQKEHGARSTWFVFPDDPRPWERFDCAFRWHHMAKWSTTERVPLRDALVRLEKEGCEVGVHGSYHSATLPPLLAEQRRELSARLGREALSVRQHYLRFDVEATPPLQAAAGFAVDSTLGMNRGFGFRSGTSFPHFLWDHANACPSSVLEVPLVIQDVSLFHHLRLDFAAARDLCREIADDVERVGGCLTVLFHPDGQRDGARFDLHAAVLADAKRRGAWMPTLRELAAWWLRSPLAAASSAS